MRRSDGPSTHHKRPRGVARLLQIGQHVVNDRSSDARNVLSQYPSWIKASDDSAKLRPEVARVGFSFTLTSDRVGLAGEAAADEIDPLKASGVQQTYVSVAGDSGPMFSKNSLAIVIVFHLPSALHPGTLKAEIDTADA